MASNGFVSCCKSTCQRKLKTCLQKWINSYHSSTSGAASRLLAFRLSLETAIHLYWCVRQRVIWSHWSCENCFCLIGHYRLACKLGSPSSTRPFFLACFVNFYLAFSRKLTVSLLKPNGEDLYCSGLFWILTRFP
jgi:hypothetical protein